MQKLIFSLVLVVLGTAVFIGVMDAGFVWNDRRTLFGESPSGAQVDHLPVDHLADAWKLVPGTAYEPLTRTAWAIVDRAAKAQSWSLPRTLHVTSLAVHLVAAVVVFLILTVLLQNAPAAFVGALLFAVHPLQVEPVAYIAAFKYVLGGCLALIAIWQYLVYAQGTDGRGRGRERPRRPYYVATVAFILALLACQAMVVTPLLAWLIAKLLPKKTSLIATRAPAWPLALWAVLETPQLIAMLRTQDTLALVSPLPLWMKPVVAADAITFYLSKVFVPVLISPDYGRSPAYVASHWWGFLTWLLPATLLLVFAYWRSKARAWYLIATALLAAAVLPFLGFFRFDAQATSTVADRFAYLALLAPALAAAYTVSMPKRSWLPLAVVAATLAFGYLSRVELTHWRDDAALWSHALAVNPASPTANTTIGDAYRRQGDWEKAKQHYERVVETNALAPDVDFYLGEIERQHGDPKTAVAYYKKTLELDPRFAQAYIRLGSAALESGDQDSALAAYRQAVALAPESVESLRSLGMLSVRRGAFAEAIPYLTKALAQDDGATTREKADTEALLGRALAATRQPDVAQGHLETALRLDPDHKEVHHTLADIYYAQGKYEMARLHYEKTLAQNQADFDVYHNLGLILARDKQHSKAIPVFVKALELKPNDPETLNALGVSEFRARQLKDAAGTFRRVLEIKPDMADPHYFLGDIAAWQGKEPEAIGEYYKALKANPNHPDANYRLGNYFMKEHKVSQAIRHYQAALKQSPDDAKLLYSLRKAEKAKDSAAAATAVEF